jgi:hypothetical protein
MSERIHLPEIPKITVGLYNNVTVSIYFEIDLAFYGRNLDRCWRTSRYGILGNILPFLPGTPYVTWTVIATIRTTPFFDAVFNTMGRSCINEIILDT